MNRLYDTVATSYLLSWIKYEHGKFLVKGCRYSDLCAGIAWKYCLQIVAFSTIFHAPPLVLKCLVKPSPSPYRLPVPHRLPNTRMHKYLTLFPSEISPNSKRNAPKSVCAILTFFFAFSHTFFALDVMSRL